MSIDSCRYDGIKLHKEKGDIIVYIFELFSYMNKKKYGYVIYKRKLFGFYERVIHGSSSSVELGTSCCELGKKRYVLLLYGENPERRYNTFKIGNTTYFEDIANENFYIRIHERIYEKDVQATNFKLLEF